MSRLAESALPIRANRKRAARSLLLTVVVLLVQGCSTSGKATKAEVIVAPNTLVVEQPIPSELRIHEQTFFSILEKRGMTRGNSGDPNALRLKLEFDPNVFSMNVIATVSQNGRVVAVGKSHNPGFGTMMNRDGSISALAAGAAAQLDSQLDELGSRLQIAQTKAQKPVSFDLYGEMNKLEDLRRRGLLTDAEFEAEKKKLLAQH